MRKAVIIRELISGMLQKATHFTKAPVEQGVPQDTGMEAIWDNFGQAFMAKAEELLDMIQETDPM